MKVRWILAACALAAAPVAGAQSFVNGGFETGDFTGWTVALTPNGATSYQGVTPYDIDGPGPLGTSLTAQFGVGRAVSSAGGTEGVTVTQALNLTGGVEYTFAFDWSAWRVSATNNAEGGVFSIIVDGAVISQQSAGSTSSATPHYGHITGIFTPGSSGSYVVGAMIGRPYTVPGDVYQNVDNFGASAVPEPATLGAMGLGLLALARRRRR